MTGRIWHVDATRWQIAVKKGALSTNYGETAKVQC